MTESAKYFALLPAAGSGSRMGSVQAKQYLSLAGRPLIAHALQTLCAIEQIAAVFVVLAADDREWQRHDWSVFGDRLVPLYCGGKTRAESVVNGLRAMQDRARDEDWVLVHDAARPCLSVEHVESLLREIGADAVGGILAQPVADTLKRAGDDGRIDATVSREHLWQAQTPQMFRCGLLIRALAKNPQVTDEAGAIEALGFHPKLVASDAANLKVTYPHDMQLAEWILGTRSRFTTKRERQ